MNKLTEREQTVKEISLRYVKNKKILIKLTEDYHQKKQWGIMDHLLKREKEEIAKYENICLDLDISLGLMVVEGDGAKIPEYDQALKIG